jgi:hypothetical protein
MNVNIDIIRNFITLKTYKQGKTSGFVIYIWLENLFLFMNSTKTYENRAKHNVASQDR